MMIRPSTLAIALLAGAPAGAQQLDLSWHTIDGGGGISVAERGGEVVELLGGIGQHDASAAEMRGGRFALTGGWLPAAPPGASEPCLADCDGSGALEFFDFLCFQNMFASGDPQADCDDSGGLDFFDFLCFQNVFTAGCP